MKNELRRTIVTLAAAFATVTPLARAEARPTTFSSMWYTRAQYDAGATPTWN